VWIVEKFMTKPPKREAESGLGLPLADHGGRKTPEFIEVRKKFPRKSGETKRTGRFKEVNGSRGKGTIKRGLWGFGLLDRTHGKGHRFIPISKITVWR